MSAWLDGVARDIDQVDQVIRTQLRTLWRERASTWSTIALTHHQASTLLRGVIPSAIASTPRRAQHARLAAAMHEAAMQLLRLNADPGTALRHTIEAPIAAALDLATEANEWVRQVRWSQATTRAGIRGWRAPVAVTGLPRLLTQEQRENAPAIALPTALQRVRELAARSRHQLAQLELALPAPPPAEVIDLRQLPLFPAAARAA